MSDKYERRDNSGSLFVNDEKHKDTSPDYSGSCVIDGREYWINAWKSKSRKGTTYLRMSFRAKSEIKSNSATASGTVDFDDEIPF
jgi:hypothetical protein